MPTDPPTPPTQSAPFPASGPSAPSADELGASLAELARDCRLAAAVALSSSHADSLTLDVAGVAVRVEADHPDLLEPFTLALRHRIAASAKKPDVVIRVWSQSTSGVARPSMPQPLAQAIARRDPLPMAPGLPGALFDPMSGILTILDGERDEVLVCLRDPADVPWYEIAAPLRAPIAWLLQRRGLLLIHSAAVATPQGAALLVGAGGAGKSTTALVCAAAGLEFLGDDVCAVSGTTSRPPQFDGVDDSNGSDGAPLIHSLYATAKTVLAEPLPVAGTRRLNPRPSAPGEKAVHLFAGPRKSSDGELGLIPSAPLRVVLLLDRRAGIERLRPASPARALGIIGSSTAPLVPAMFADSLAVLRRVVASVPVLELSLSPDRERVPAQVADAIAAGAMHRFSPDLAELPPTRARRRGGLPSAEKFDAAGTGARGPSVG